MSWRSWSRFLSRSDRATARDRAVAQTRGVALPSTFLRYLLARGGRGNRPLIDDDVGLRSVGRIAAKRIARLATDSRLSGQRSLVELMYAWREFETEDMVNRWAAEQAASPEGLLRLFQAFVGYGRSDGGHPLADFIDLDAAVKRADEWLESDGLSEDTASGLRKAMAARREFYSG